MMNNNNGMQMQKKSAPADPDGSYTVEENFGQ